MGRDPQIDRIFANLGRVLTGVVRTVTETVTFELRDRTPVDTGHARSNWVPSPSNQTSVDGSREGVSYGAQSAGLQWLHSGYQFPQPAYVVNNVHYITSLNAGSSRQAPSNFVHEAIDRAILDAHRRKI